MSQVNFPSASESTPGASQLFTLDIDVPSSYTHTQGVAPQLLYPIEVAAIANWSVPQSEDAWPKVDSIPESGLLLWIVQGDVSYDYEVMPVQGDWFVASAYTYLDASQSATSSRPEPGTPEVVQAERAISGIDKVAGPWTGCSTWARFVPLTNASGETSERPPYLVIYVFAGSDEPEMRPVSEMVETLTVRYN